MWLFTIRIFEQASSIYWYPNVSNGVARQVIRVGDYCDFNTIANPVLGSVLLVHSIQKIWHIVVEMGTVVKVISKFEVF